MPRASDGTYSLPAGNPVATLSVISSTWANTTLSDVSTALTGSLDRSGQGAMLAGLKLFDGVVGAPGLTWGTDTTSGLYRNGAADFRFSISAVDLLQLGTNLFQVSGTAPVHRWNESDAAANNRLWDIIASGEDLNFRVLTDALVATNWLTVTRTAGVVDAIAIAATTITSSGQHLFTATGSSGAIQINNTAPILSWFESDAAASNRAWRAIVNGEQFSIQASADDFATSNSFLDVNRTGTTLDTVNFPNGTLQYGGSEIGLRDIPRNARTSSYTIVSSDRGKIVTHGTGAADTFTFDDSLPIGSVVMVTNYGTGPLTLAGSGVTIEWLNGSGTLSTGNRTLAIAGTATFWKPAAGFWDVWGAGIS